MKEMQKKPIFITSFDLEQADTLHNRAKYSEEVCHAPLDKSK